MWAVLLGFLVSASPLQELSHAQILKHKAKEMFNHGFDSYLAFAFPADMLRSVSCQPRHRLHRSDETDYEELVLGNFSMTLIDSLDSLLVFNRTEDFIRYSEYVIEHVTFDRDVVVSLFEVNIRVLGGLLSAHVLQRKLGLMQEYEDGLLGLAEDLGKRLLPAFNTTTGIPRAHINLKYGLSANPSDTITTAEASTILLEFTLLSYLTGDYVFRDAAQRVIKALAAASTADFMSGTVINVQTGLWMTRYMTIGASLDSYFEYLVKAYIAYGCNDCLTVFYKAYESVRKYMVHDGWILEVTIDKKLLHSATLSSLAAFWPGMEVSLGHLPQAIELHSLFYSVWAHYSALPDVVNLYDGELISYGRNYPLRPELIESTFYLYQATHHPIYLAIAEKIMLDIDSSARTRCGFATIADVSKGRGEFNDNMESFFLSETVKYLYLLFHEAEKFYYAETRSRREFLCTGMCCDFQLERELVDTDKFVLSTEGHFFPLLAKEKLLSLGHEQPPAAEFTSSPVGNHTETASYIRAQLSDIYYSHGLQDRSTPYQAIQRPRIFDQLPTITILEEPTVIMRLFVLKGSSIVEEMLVFGASFGLVFPYKMTLTPKLVLSEPITACSKLESKERYKGKFVLAIRGDCLFIQKAHMAQRAGAIGLVVYDNEQTDVLMTMKGDKDWADVKIWGAFTSNKNGILLM